MRTTVRLCSVQICCGLCIYRRQFGLRICCGDDDNDDESASERRARRKTHVVLATQYNRAFDDSAAAVDRCPTEDARQPPSSTKENGISAAAETTPGNQTSEQAGRDVDSTGANAGTDGKVLDDSAVASGESHSSDAAADNVDVEEANEAQVDDEITNAVDATTTDDSDKVDDTVSDRSSADVNRSADPQNRHPASSLSATTEETVEPDSHMNNAGEATAADTSRSAVTDDGLISKTLEPEVEFMQVTLPEAENNCRTKTAPVPRRWRSMGAGSGQRRVINASTCDKAVDVHEDDLVVQPEPEVVTGNETDVTTDEECRSQEEDTVKEQSDGNGKTGRTPSVDEAVLDSSLMVRNIVLDLEELGVVSAHDNKQQEVSQHVFPIETELETENK